MNTNYNNEKSNNLPRFQSRRRRRPLCAWCVDVWLRRLRGCTDPGIMSVVLWVRTEGPAEGRLGMRERDGARFQCFYFNSSWGEGSFLIPRKECVVEWKERWCTAKKKSGCCVNGMVGGGAQISHGAQKKDFRSTHVIRTLKSLLGIGTIHNGQTTNIFRSSLVSWFCTCAG